MTQIILPQDTQGFPAPKVLLAASAGTFLYQWFSDTNTGNPTTSGLIKANNSSLISVTQINISSIDLNGNTIDNVLLPPCAFRIMIGDPINPNNFAIYKVSATGFSGNPNDNFLTCSLVSAGGQFINGQYLFVAVDITFAPTQTNDNAPTGQLGEYVSAAATGVALTTAVAKTLVSISLGAGDWDVMGLASYTGAATTSYTACATGISNAANTFGGIPSYTSVAIPAFVPTALWLTAISPMVRFSLATTTTIFLIGRTTHTVSTSTATGNIWARRMR